MIVSDCLFFAVLKVPFNGGCRMGVQMSKKSFDFLDKLSGAVKMHLIGA